MANLAKIAIKFKRFTPARLFFTHPNFATAVFCKASFLIVPLRFQMKVVVE